MTRSERIAAHIANRIVHNRTRMGFSSLYEEALQKEYNMTSYKDVPNTKVSDTHGMPMPDGGIAEDIKVAVGVTVLQGSYKNSGDHGNGMNEDGAERVQMPNNPAPREAKGQSEVGPRCQ